MPRTRQISLALAIAACLVTGAGGPAAFAGGSDGGGVDQADTHDGGGGAGATVGGAAGEAAGGTAAGGGSGAASGGAAGGAAGGGAAGGGTGGGSGSSGSGSGGSGGSVSGGDPGGSPGATDPCGAPTVSGGVFNTHLGPVQFHLDTCDAGMYSYTLSQELSPNWLTSVLNDNSAYTHPRWIWHCVSMGKGALCSFDPVPVNLLSGDLS